MNSHNHGTIARLLEKTSEYFPPGYGTALGAGSGVGKFVASGAGVGEGAGAGVAGTPNGGCPDCRALGLTNCDFMAGIAAATHPAPIPNTAWLNVTTPVDSNNTPSSVEP